MTTTTAGKTGVTIFTTPTDLDIVFTRVVDAPRRIVFEAFTNPKHVPNWLLGPDGWTMPICEIDSAARRRVAIRLSQARTGKK